MGADKIGLSSSASAPTGRRPLTHAGRASFFGPCRYVRVFEATQVTIFAAPAIRPQRHSRPFYYAHAAGVVAGHRPTGRDFAINRRPPEAAADHSIGALPNFEAEALRRLA